MKLFHVVSTAILGTTMAIGVGLALNKTQVQQAKAAEEDASYNVSSIISTTYKAYSNDDFVVTFGGGGGSMGTNSGTNWEKLNLSSYSKYAVDPVTTDDYATAVVMLKSTSNVVKMKFAYTSGTNGNKGKIYAIYSENNTTFSKLTITSGTSQGAQLPGNSGTMTFNFAKCSGYFGIVLKSDNTSGNWKYGGVTLTLTYDNGGATTYNMTYNGNGGSGTVTDENSPYSPGATVTVKSNGFTRKHFNFTNWNTAADGSGTSYNPGAQFTINSHTTLHAQWEIDAASTYTDDTTNKTITWNLTEETYISSSKSQVTWSSPKATLVADKAGASSDANQYLPPAESSSRFYKNSTMTISPVGDNGIIKVEATATTTTYASNLQSSTFENASAAVSDTLVTITPVDGTESIVATLDVNAVGLSQLVVYYGEAVPVTKYSVIDHVDNGSLNKDEVAEGTTLNVTIIPDAGYEVPTSLTAVTMAGNPVAYTYNAGVVTVVNVQGNITIEGECVRSNPIKALYSKSGGAAVDVYGYYVGFLDGTGPVIMDGEYGIVIYDKEADVSSYVEKTTILHVTGSISIYKELYEIGSASITKVDSYAGELDAPVVYSTQGGETAEYASRLTTLTGKLTAVTTGSLDAEPAASDIKMTFSVNSNDITVFYKKAAQKSADMAALKAVLSTENEITVKGFTSWYTGFQIQMSDVVGEDPSYTAAIFAQDLLDQTDVVCAEYNPSTNPNVDRDALVAIWSDLASADKYPTLPAAQKTILAEAEGDKTSVDVVEQAMARYDLLTAKYNLNNFINGRNPSSGARGISLFGNTNTSIVVISCIVAASVSTLAAGLILTIKKRKHY